MGHCQLREGLVPSSLWKPLGPRLARAADTRVTPLSCVKVAGDFFPYPVCLTDGIFDSFVDCERATHTCRLAHWWTPLRVDGLPREVVSSLRMIGPCFLATWRFEDKAIWNDGPRCPQSMSTSISECHFPLRYIGILLGFYWVLLRFYWDSMDFIGILLGFYWILLDFIEILLGFDGFY